MNYSAIMEFKPPYTNILPLVKDHPGLYTSLSQVSPPTEVDTIN
jgi:hypothetical protein